MRINMILFTIMIEANKLNCEDYKQMNAVKNEMLDRKADNFNKLF
ncbi:hypothetical protein [Pradoshia eiseniae]|nr:hypothetical protein [Pradoshia eiseniae]